MDCNKDEAIRAKDIAHKKMQSDDFEGAKKFALKAQNLYSELENIGQMLTTCSVHCSAQNKIFGSEMDWYGILQVDKFAKESDVKKQYRKLALIIHPDKNRFPGADGAFKLICEARALLLDAKKKSEYDSKIKVMLQTTRFAAQSQQFNQQTSAQSRVSNYFNNMNKNQTAYSSSAVNLDTFWTCCPACHVRYKYLRRYLNNYLRCQSCKITFFGCETGTRGASMGTNTGQASEQHVPPKPQTEQTAESVGVGKTSDTEAVNSNQNVEKATSDSKAVNSDQNVEKASGNEGVEVANPTKASGDPSDAIDKDVRNMNNKSKTGSKKFVVESDESSDTGSDETPANQTSEPSQVHYSRRSSRKRDHVSYNETDEDDFASPVKRRRHTESGDGEEHNDASKSKNVESETVEQKDTVSNNEDSAGGKIDADDPVDISSDFRFSSDDDSTNDVSQCPDPEFSNFDQEREQSRFKVGQFWACYDSFDGMPRFYARVKNVHASPFELTFTWLEADPIHEAQIKWAEELPVGCGRFKLGQTEKTSLLPTFSHQMICEKGSKRNNFVIYPREGEVWALFKDWDISWSWDPHNHQHFKYEVVEVLSNFNEKTGVSVIHMNKISGFVSLFERTARACSFLIKPHELYRFSHRILCNKMTGHEREGVPPGSYELDPASLPSNPEDLHYPHRTDSEVHCSPMRSVNEECRSGTSTHCKNTLETTEEIDVESFKLRRSPRGLNGMREKVK